MLAALAISFAIAAAPAEPIMNEQAVRPPARAHGAFLRDYAETRRFMAGRPAMAGLTPDGTAALFLRSGARSAVQSLYETNLLTGETRLLADAEKLLAGASQELSVEERARLERQRNQRPRMDALRGRAPTPALGDRPRQKLLPAPPLHRAH